MEEISIHPVSREDIIGTFLDETLYKILSGEITYDQAPAQFKQRVSPEPSQSASQPPESPQHPEL